MARGVAFRLRAPVIREPELHKQIADVLRLELAPPGKVSAQGVIWYSIDIAAYAGTVPGLRTARGVVAGIPDVFVLWRGLGHFIEIKADDGMLSPAQESLIAGLLVGGGRVGVARNAIEVLACLDRWGVPRAHRIKEMSECRPE